MSKVVRTLLSADKDARLKMLGRSALNLAANTNHVTACGPLPDASEVHQNHTQDLPQHQLGMMRWC